MKKINLILITLMLIFGAKAYAWDINNSELGIGFTISNNWTEEQYTGTGVSFINTLDEHETLEIAALEVGYGMQVSYEYMLSVCQETCSDSEISAMIVDVVTKRNIYPAVRSLSERYDKVTYNGVEYFNYVKEYETTKTNYKNGYGIISSFLTLQNDKLYIIIYNLYESPPVTKGRTYYNSEIFRVLNSVSYDPGTIKIFVNGTRIYPDSNPMIIEGRTVIPIRAVAESLGYNVNWDPTKQAVNLFPNSNGMPVLQLQIGNPYLLKNYEQEIPLDVYPFIFNGRTYLPLRAVSENMNAMVSWDQSTKTVSITR